MSLQAYGTAAVLLGLGKKGKRFLAAVWFGTWPYGHHREWAFLCCFLVMPVASWRTQAYSSHSFALLKSTWLKVLIGFVSFLAQVSRCPMRRWCWVLRDAEWYHLCSMDIWFARVLLCPLYHHSQCLLSDMNPGTYSEFAHLLTKPIVVRMCDPDHNAKLTGWENGAFMWDFWDVFETTATSLDSQDISKFLLVKLYPIYPPMHYALYYHSPKKVVA